MVLSFPALCGLLLLYVHAVVEFAPRSLREHRVTYRPIKTRVADWLLIVRLGCANLLSFPVQDAVEEQESAASM